MSENYIMLNGKRVDLTDEQLEKLGLKIEKKDYFKRAKFLEHYCAMDMSGRVVYVREDNAETDKSRHKIANYCTDKSLMEQRALHETLSRLLWRFSMQNDGDKIDWDDDEQWKYYIYYDHKDNTYNASYCCMEKHSTCYFYSQAIAKKAIDEIILPFMKEHPEFIW